MQIIKKKIDGKVFYDSVSYMNYLQNSKKWFNSYKPWTKDDHKKLIKYVNEGLTNTQIGKKMHRVTGGVSSRIKKLVDAQILVDKRSSLSKKNKKTNSYRKPVNSFNSEIEFVNKKSGKSINLKSLYKKYKKIDLVTRLSKTPGIIYIIGREKDFILKHISKIQSNLDRIIWESQFNGEWFTFIKLGEENDYFFNWGYKLKGDCLDKSRCFYGSHQEAWQDSGGFWRKGFICSNCKQKDHLELEKLRNPHKDYNSDEEMSSEEAKHWEMDAYEYQGDPDDFDSWRENNGY